MPQCNKRRVSETSCWVCSCQFYIHK